jgi:predicted small lipoprotein YifL
MRRFFAMVLAALAVLQLSCGDQGPSNEPPADLESLPPDFLSPPSTWPDAEDLGVLVSSGVDPTSPRPPPPPIDLR